MFSHIELYLQEEALLGILSFGHVYELVAAADPYFL